MALGQAHQTRSDAAAPDRSAPVAPEDRFIAIDVLRGLALFGVMAINLIFEFRVSIFEQFLPGERSPPALDRALEIFLNRAIEMKAFALFSLLFGVGLAIQFERLSNDPRRTLLLVRRIGILLAFGVVHLVLIWNGDILTEYALAGILVLPFLFGPQWLLAAAAAGCLCFYLVVPPLMAFPDSSGLAQYVSEARHIYATGGFLDVLALRVKEIGAIAPLHAAVFPRTVGLLLLGAFIWRTGVLQRASDDRMLLLALAVAGWVTSVTVRDSELTAITLAISYGAVVICAMTTPVSRALLWAAPLGRMAFTNYLAQSLIFGWVFYGYGLGLFGRVGVAAALTFGIAIYAVQVVLSRWWLSRHHFGPVEWLWRRLMYGTPQPMRFAKALA